MHIQFAELPVFDQDRAKAFYIDHLNCRVVADQPMSDEGWRWIELGFPDANSALHFLTRKDEAASEGPVLVLVDNDVDVTVQRLKSQGVEIITDPRAAPWQPGRMIAESRDSEAIAW
jgi:predicted enzyme related to lactoylglutathione lyase